MNEDRAARYHRLRRRSAVASTVAGVAWLTFLLATGRAADLAAWTRGLASPLGWPMRPVTAITLYVAVLAAGWETVSLPFVFYRNFVLDRKYGLSFEPVTAWVADYARALALGFVLTAASALVVYGAIHLAPGAWWFIAAGLFLAASAVMSVVAPIWLMPLFYTFKPLERDALRARLLALSGRAGVPAIGAFEWGLGEKTTRANAALAGAGRTRRILISDTLLKDYSEDEIEVILAHEMAHHVHYDIWTALALETAVVSTVLHGAHVTTMLASPALGLHGPGDLAALPLMILSAGLGSLLLAPLTNAWSRHNERRADRFALRLTDRPAAFVSAMKRLGAQNLAEEHPSRLVYWFLHTHPTMDERIAAARSLDVEKA